MHKVITMYVSSKHIHIVVINDVSENSVAQACEHHPSSPARTQEKSNKIPTLEQTFYIACTYDVWYTVNTQAIKTAQVYVQIKYTVNTQ